MGRPPDDVKVSVVVPTYNRGPALRKTIEGLLSSRTAGLDALDVHVVDDGSLVPAGVHLQGLLAGSSGRLRVTRQRNSGPARARNEGFRKADGDVVLFVDDDVIVPNSLVQQHAKAHEQRPGSVICGRCNTLPPPKPGAVFRLMTRLYDAVDEQEAYLLVEAVASGQLSLRRDLFVSEGAVYRDDLLTPGAEEAELSARLARRGVPIWHANGIVALHDTPTAIADICRQQYKHGFGCGEAARRYPETLALGQFRRVIDAALPAGDGVRDRARRLALHGAGPRARALVLRLARWAERIAPQEDGLCGLYRQAIGLHFIGGVRDGLRQFGSGVGA